MKSYDYKQLKLNMQGMYSISICTVNLASQNCPFLHTAFSAYFAGVKVAAIFREIHQTKVYQRLDSVVL